LKIEVDWLLIFFYIFGFIGSVRYIFSSDCWECLVLIQSNLCQFRDLLLLSVTIIFPNKSIYAFVISMFLMILLCLWICFTGECHAIVRNYTVTSIIIL
jgi:hypothetical protein